MKKIFSICCLFAIAIIFESSIVNGNIPPTGISFNSYFASFSTTIEAEKGIGWNILNLMKTGALTVSYTVSGGGASTSENVTLFNYNSKKVGALEPSEGGLISYTALGNATCNYTSEDRAPYGAIVFFYYKSELT